MLILLVVFLTVVLGLLISIYFLKDLNSSSSSKFPLPTLIQNTPTITPPIKRNELLILQQQKGEHPYGAFSRVLLQNLTIQDYRVDGDKLILSLNYQKGGQLQTLKIEVRNRFGDDNGLQRITPDFINSYFSLGDKLDITIDYKSSIDNLTKQSIMEYFSNNLDLTSQERQALLNYNGDFGDKILSFEDIESRLEQLNAEFKPDEIRVASISNFKK